MKVRIPKIIPRTYNIAALASIENEKGGSRPVIVKREMWFYERQNHLLLLCKASIRENLAIIKSRNWLNLISSIAFIASASQCVENQ